MSSLFTEERRVTYYDLDYRGKLKLSAFLRMAHIAADINAKTLGIGFDDLNPLDISFVLQRFGVRVIRMPVYDEIITLRTWPAAIERGIFIRKGDITAQNGSKCMEWTSIWVLFDIKERKILRPNALPVPLTGMGNLNVEIEAKKIVPPTGEKTEVSVYTHVVRYSEVDTNRHMNNCIYGDLINNVFHQDWHEMQINFLAEAVIGDEIIVSCLHSGSAYYITGENAGKTTFSVVALS